MRLSAMKRISIGAIGIMSSTSIGLIVREQAWFRPFVEVEALPEFPLSHVDSIPIEPVNAVRARILIGTGPLDHELQAHFTGWFEHGAEPYPTLQLPSVGPAGAGLKGKATPVRITASKEEAISVIETSVVTPVDPTIAESYLAQPQPQIDETGRRVSTEAQRVVENVIGDVKRRLEQAIGFYALYQYPIVWEPLGVWPLVAFVDFQKQTIQHATTVIPDNFIPFRLNPKEKVQDGSLSDDGLKDWGRLGTNDLHVPLVAFQRALWQKNIQVRFLEMFWVIEHLAGDFDGLEDERREREAMFEVMRRSLENDDRKHLELLDRLKGLIVQPSLRERLEGYFAKHGIEHEPDIVPRMLRLRNNLSHGGAVEVDELLDVELRTRSLAQIVFCRELSAKGVEWAAGVKQHPALPRRR